MPAERKYIARRSGLFASLMQATELAGFRLEPLAPVSLRDVYFDTPAGGLLRQGYSLRVREQGASTAAQLRALRAPDGARAREADAILDAPIFGDELSELPQGPLREMLDLLAGDEPLRALLRLRQYRSARVAYDGTRLVGVISLDVVGYELAARLHVANEIEIELAGTGREGDLFRLDPVLRASGLEPTSRSKFERGVLRLQRGPDDPILLLPYERAALERMLEAPDPALRRRARVVLLAARGQREETVSARAGLSPSRVRHWVQRFREGRISALRTPDADPQTLSRTPDPGPAPAGPPAFRVSEIVSRGVPTAALFRPEHFTDPEAFSIERSREDGDGSAHVGAGGDGAAGRPPRERDPLPEFDVAADPPFLAVIPVEPAEPAIEPEPPSTGDVGSQGMGEETPRIEGAPAKPAAAAEPSAAGESGRTDRGEMDGAPTAETLAANGGEDVAELRRPPGRPRLRPDTPIIEAAGVVLRYHFRNFAGACEEVGATGDPAAARRALLAAHRVRLALETFADFLPQRATERLHDRLRGAARALDALVDFDAALARLASVVRASPLEDRSLLEQAAHELAAKRERARRRAVTRITATRHVQWARRMERLIAMLDARVAAGDVAARFFRKAPDDYVGDGKRRPRRLRLHHMLASTLWSRYEAIRAYERLIGDADEGRLRPLGVACAALGFVLGLAGDTAPFPSRAAGRALGELEGALAEMHRACVAAGHFGDVAGLESIAAAERVACEAARVAVPGAWSAVDSEDFRRRLADVAAAL